MDPRVLDKHSTRLSSTKVSVVDASITSVAKSLASADLAVRAKLHHFSTIKYTKLAQFLVYTTCQKVVLDSKGIKKHVSFSPARRNAARQRIVIQIKFHEAVISHIGIGFRNRSHKLIVVQIQKTKPGEIHTHIGWESPAELVEGKIKVKSMT